VSFDKIHRALPGFLRCRGDPPAGAGELREPFERIASPEEIFQFRAFTRLDQLESPIWTRPIEDEFYWRY